MSGLSALYPNARQGFATGVLNWPALSVKAMLMDSNYTPNFSNVYLSDVTSANIIATTADFTGLSAVNGYCTGNSAGFGVIDDEREAASLIFYQDTGTASTSLLLVYFDTPDLPGLPQVLDGLNYYVYQNLNYGGWFRL